MLEHCCAVRFAVSPEAARVRFQSAMSDVVDHTLEMLNRTEKAAMQHLKSEQLWTEARVVHSLASKDAACWQDVSTCQAVLQHAQQLQHVQDELRSCEARVASIAAAHTCLDPLLDEAQVCLPSSTF